MGNRLSQDDVDKVEQFTRNADAGNRDQASVLEEMKSHLKKLQDIRKGEDPRLSFSTPEFKEAQRVFTDNFKKNFGRPVEYAMVKEYPWSTPQLTKLKQPVDVNGKPWPMDAEGKPVLKA